MSRAVAIFAGLLLAPGWASAGEFHFETFRYGQRAMGMGGAATGMAFEPESSYYNPAGLALIERGAQFSGALNFFGVDRRTQRGALRDGGLFAPRDLQSTDFLPIPSGSVISTRIGRHAASFSTFLLGDLDERYAGNQVAPFIGDPLFTEQRFTRSFRRLDRLQLRGFTYAYTPNDGFSAGISAFWLQHDREQTARRAQIVGAPGVPTNQFIDVTTRERSRTHGLLLRAGVAWRPAPEASFGLACSLPSVPLIGETTFGYTIIKSGDLQAGGTDPNRQPLYLAEEITRDAQTQLPFNCRAGVALRASSRWLVSGDLSIHLPITYTRFDPSSALGRDDLDPTVRTEFTLNIMLGTEYLLTPKWPLRMGLFSNRTNAPEVPAHPRRHLPAHMDLYGMTTSLGYLGERRSINLGLEVQYGRGEDVVSESLASLLDEAGYARVQREDWRVVVFIAGAAAFASKTAKELIKKNKLLE